MSKPTKTKAAAAPAAPACRDCRFLNEAFGLCMRYPPVPLVGAVVRPRVAPNDWCGEFRR